MSAPRIGERCLCRFPHGGYVVGTVTSVSPEAIVLSPAERAPASEGGLGRLIPCDWPVVVLRADLAP